ncbi:MAG TPA: hypothetical protein VFZ71_02110 [Pyrinomonadaceae bacterium]
MLLQISEELIQLFREIVREQKTEEQWAEIESDDMFQTPSFCGGFESLENAFCFSYFNDEQQEFWFQLTLGEVRKAVAGELTTVEIRRAG